MTMNQHHKWLINYKLGEAEKNRRMVLNAIKDLTSALPRDIERFLKKKREEEIQHEYENSKIDKSEMETRIKKGTIHMRTIMRCLAELTEKGLLEHNGKKYRLSPSILGDIRYWAEEFGSFALNSIMKAHFPMLNTLEVNLKILVEIFGLYVVYCFVEGARPVQKADSLSSTESDMLSYSWVKNMFDPNNMYLYFLSAIKNQPEDKEVQKFISNLREDSTSGKIIWTDYEGKEIRSPTSNSELSYELFTQVTTPHDKYPEQPNYALDKEKIDKIINILKKQYPSFYKQLLTAREGYTKEMTLLQD
jgi:hypothetical protein